MRVSRKAIVAIVATGAVAAGGAAAYAATNHASTGHDPQPPARYGHSGPMGHALPTGMRDVLGQIRGAVLDQAPAIVDPILDQAVAAGHLTGDQAATAKQALAGLKAGDRPSAGALALLRDAQARAVLGDAFQAVARQVPAIAKPILADAVAKGTIDQATADRLSERIQAIADWAANGGLPFGPPAARPGAPLGHGPHGHGPFSRPGAKRGAPFGPGHHARPSAQTAGVLADIAQAVARQAPTVAGPIIDQAVAAGTITSAQATELKSAAGDLASGDRGALFAHRDLMADAGVRDVVRDVFRALAAQAPAIAKPIIDQAVSDGTLTQAQADRLTQRIADAAKRAGG
jgi:ribosomal protein S20